MPAPTLDLWDLTLGRQQVDPDDLADAVVAESTGEPLDYRTRLLIRDSLDALRNYWGPERFRVWFERCACRDKLEAIGREEFDKVGFPSLRRRLMDKTRPDVIRQFLEHVGQSLHSEAIIHIAGSVALILPGYLVRHTEDIDLIDEVPKEIRENHELLAKLQDHYGLRLGHVQSHYFAPGWQDRVHSLGAFGRLQVFLLDVYDVFLSKLFSARLKDMGDMRELLPQLDKTLLAARLKETCGSFLTDDRLRHTAQDNWQILFGEPLPQ